MSTDSRQLNQESVREAQQPHVGLRNSSCEFEYRGVFIMAENKGNQTRLDTKLTNNTGTLTRDKKKTETIYTQREQATGGSTAEGNKQEHRRQSRTK